MGAEWSVLFYLGIVLLGGLFFGRLVKHIKLPNVTGYLIAGLLLGPYVTRFLSAGLLAELDLVSEVALGFIAFSIGSEFKLSYFKKVGVMPIVIAIFEGLGAVLFVTVAMLAIGQPFPFAIVIGAIASATAPAATIMVIKQYQAKGPLTQTLLSVVALDDAVALISFGFSVAIARSMQSAGGSTPLLQSLLEPFLEIFLAAVIGTALALLFAVPLRYFKKKGNRLCITCAFIFLATALAEVTGASALLTTMIMSAVLVNISRSAPDILQLADSVTAPIYMMFFVISGAELNLAVLPEIGLVGVVYVLARVAGKWLGATGGAVLAHAGPSVKKYLGPTLIPQAGVAIGLTLVAQNVVPEFAQEIRAIVLCGTFIYEIIGPMVAKMCLKKAGEIKPENL